MNKKSSDAWNPHEMAISRCNCEFVSSEPLPINSFILHCKLADRRSLLETGQSLPLNTVRNLAMPIPFDAYSFIPMLMKPAIESCT